MNDANQEIMDEIGKEMNCKDCGNWLCGANGKNQDVLCFLGYPKKGAREDV